MAESGVKEYAMRKTAGRELLATLVAAFALGLLLLLATFTEITALQMPLGLAMLSFNAPFDTDQRISYARIMLVSAWVVWPLAWAATRGVQRWVGRSSWRTKAAGWLWQQRLPWGRSLALAFAVWVALFFANLYLPWEL